METFWDFYISCFSFFLLDLPFLVHPSIILWLILKIKINELVGCFLQLAKLQRQNYFLKPCIYILVARLLSSLFVFKFCFSHVHNTLSIKFSWWRWRGVMGVFYTFSSLNPLLIFPVQSFLLLSCFPCFKHPSLLSRDFPSTFFCSIYFSSCFLFLVFT